MQLMGCSVKTKVQQRALAGERYRGPLETMRRLVRGEAVKLPDHRIVLHSYRA